jgi:hypothetical protein
MQDMHDLTACHRVILEPHAPLNRGRQGILSNDDALNNMDNLVSMPR